MNLCDTCIHKNPCPMSFNDDISYCEHYEDKRLYVRFDDKEQIDKIIEVMKNG